MTIWIEPLSGSIGALSSTLILHPLDTLKVMLQSNNLNLRSTFLEIQKGKNWYSGVAANLSGNMIAWSSYFFIYSEFKKFVDPFFAGTAAGACTLLLSNPFFVAKTRMITEPKHYVSLVNCIVTIFKLEGLGGLYSGLGIGMIGTLHGGIQFYSYEKIKTAFNLDDSRFNTLNYLMASGSSKIIASFVTYPYQVIRTKLQQRNNEKNIRQIVNHIYKNSGFVGFYRGLIPGIARVLPASMITLTAYEASKRGLNKLVESE
eukprot:NODE_14_length_51535_cov_1.125049.p29 type:complete len:260 gc:universal NODE_14_length_51535_cov_1.125049:25875-26654(+)